MTRFAALNLVLILPGLALAQTRPEAEAFFEAKIRPVLAGTCFRCHGGDKVSGGLRMDSRAALLKGGDSGLAIVPGEPAKSLLLEALRHTGDIKMPPDKKLPQHTVADFGTWIKNGAPWPKSVTVDFDSSTKHWAFQPLKNPTVPDDPTGWSDNPIDRFIAARQDRPEPSWPTSSFDEIVEKAFHGNVIGDEGHPLLKKLRGE